MSKQSGPQNHRSPPGQQFVCCDNTWKWRRFPQELRAGLLPVVCCLAKVVWQTVLRSYWVLLEWHLQTRVHIQSRSRKEQTAKSAASSSQAKQQAHRYVTFTLHACHLDITKVMKSQKKTEVLGMDAGHKGGRKNAKLSHKKKQP